MKVRDIIKEVEAAGWEYHHSTGSHRIFRHPKRSGTVTIPGQYNADVHPRTLASIRKEAGVRP